MTSAGPQHTENARQSQAPARWWATREVDEAVETSVQNVARLVGELLAAAQAESEAIIDRAQRQAQQIIEDARRQAYLELHSPRASAARTSWGRLVHRLRWGILAIAAVFTAFAVAWGPGVVPHLANGGFDVPGSQSFNTDKQISQTIGRPSPDIIALYRSSTHSVDDAVYAKAISDVVTALPRQGVASVTSYWTTKSDAMVSADRRSTFVGIYLSGSEDARIATYRRLSEQLRVSGDVASVQLGGVIASDAQISDQVSADLTRSETISAPVLAVLLILVFGGLTAAAAPLLVGAVTVVGALVVMRVLNTFTDISVFAINIVTLLGLGLAIDYALLLVSRFREELAMGHDSATALERTMRTAGRSIVISALIVSVSLSGLLFFPMLFLRSMAYGGVAVVALAALVATTVLPAALAALGPKINSLSLPWHNAARGRPHAPGHGAWARLARVVMRRPLFFIAAVLVLLSAMAWPVRDVAFGGIDSRQLPTSAPARQVTTALAEDFPQLQNEPILVLVTGGDKASITSTTAKISTLPGVKSVLPAGNANATSLFAVHYEGEAVDDTARGIVTAIRALPAPSGTSVAVGGYSAQQVDLRASIARGAWRMALLIVLVTFVFLFWAFGSFVVAAKAVVVTLATIMATLGVIVLVFQQGHGANLLDFIPTGSVELTQPILVAAILFGLTTDYEIFLLSRIREHWDLTHDNEESVAHGLERSGPIITSAAALILVVIVAFSTSQIIFIKLIGVGMAVSILLDATVMRALLVPATMRLLGRWNWWAPGPLLRWWERHRPQLD